MKTKKNTFFEKRTGEVAENKGSGPKNEPERTGKRSGEVVENTFLWEKRTENEPENRAVYVVENNGRLNNVDPRPHLKNRLIPGRRSDQQQAKLHAGKRAYTGPNLLVTS